MVAHSAWTSRRSKPRQAEPASERSEPREPGMHGDAESPSQSRFADELQAQREAFGASEPLPVDNSTANYYYDEPVDLHAMIKEMYV